MTNWQVRAWHAGVWDEAIMGVESITHDVWDEDGANACLLAEVSKGEFVPVCGDSLTYQRLDACI